MEGLNSSGGLWDRHELPFHTRQVTTMTLTATFFSTTNQNQQHGCVKIPKMSNGAQAIEKVGGRKCCLLFIYCLLGEYLPRALPLWVV